MSQRRDPKDVAFVFADAEFDGHANASAFQPKRIAGVDRVRQGQPFGETDLSQLLKLSGEQALRRTRVGPSGACTSARFTRWWGGGEAIS